MDDFDRQDTNIASVSKEGRVEEVEATVVKNNPQWQIQVPEAFQTSFQRDNQKSNIEESNSNSIQDPKKVCLQPL